MKVIFYSTRKYEINYLTIANKSKHELCFNKNRLTSETVYLSKGFDAVCVFIYDHVSEIIIKDIMDLGVRFIILRAAGYDNIDLIAAKKLKIKVAYIPDYSPDAVAEHALCLILALNRQIKTSIHQAKLNSFSIDPLIGFNLHNSSVGIIGIGKIGSALCKILNGFECKTYAYDLQENVELSSKYGVNFVGLNELYQFSDIISLHVPLNKNTYHLIDNNAIQKMKKNVMIINTARGAIVNTVDIIINLKKGNIGYYGADVIENEEVLFFDENKSMQGKENWLITLNKMNNVIITPHQAFATITSLKNIAEKVFYQLDCWEKNLLSTNELCN